MTLRMIIYMAMEAVAAYLRTIRQARGYTQESLAEAAQTSKSTIERLERAEGDLTVQPFARIVNVLQASAEHVTDLAISSSATVRDAQALADAWLSGDAVSLNPDQISIINEEVRATIAVLRRLSPDQLVAVMYELSRIMYARRIAYMPRLQRVPRPYPSRRKNR